MIRISMKGLAKYMTASDARKRKILRDYKFPDPEGSAQATYYREAFDFIEAYHKNNHPREWLEGKAELLRTLSSGATGPTKTRLQNNARALEQYAQYFSKKKYIVLPGFKSQLDVEGVIITVVPDLYVKEGKADKIIKLELRKGQIHPDVPKAVCQLIYEATLEVGMNMSGSQILYIDVPRGIIHKDARIRSRMKVNIEAACKNIVSIWDGIQK